MAKPRTHRNSRKLAALAALAEEKEALESSYEKVSYLKARYLAISKESNRASSRYDAIANLSFPMRFAQDLKDSFDDFLSAISGEIKMVKEAHRIVSKSDSDDG